MDKEITVRKRISEDTKFTLPVKIKKVIYKEKIFVISPETASWIILENEEQWQFFQLLTSFDLGNALKQFNGAYDNAQYTVTQIVAKHFDNQLVKPKNNGGSMQMYLTNECNMRCPHCYMFAGLKKDRELSTKEIFDIISSFKKHGGNNIVFSGGEIALRKDLYEILKHSYDLGISNEILTNGTLWNAELVQKVVPLISRVQISIDGYDEATNSRIRGKGNFSRALNAVTLFYETNVDTEISVTPYLDEDLAENYQYYIDFARMLNQKYSRANFLVKFTFDVLNGREIRVSEKQKKDYQGIVTKIYNELYGDFVDKPFLEFHKHGGIENNCDYGNIAISADGNVCLCPIIPEMKPVGNVRVNSFDELLDIAQKARALSNINNLSPCKDCELKYICGGECRIKHFSGFKENNLSIIATSKRVCSQEHKNMFYDMMLNLNEAMYR